MNAKHIWRVLGCVLINPIIIILFSGLCFMYHVVTKIFTSFEAECIN